MKRQDKIDLILVLKKSIKILKSKNVSYICGTFKVMAMKDMFTKEVLVKAKEYLFSEIPTSTYNNTFYQHRLFNRNNDYYQHSYDENMEIPWWTIYNDKHYDGSKAELNALMAEIVEQRILFLRILIDKLNK